MGSSVTRVAGSKSNLACDPYHRPGFATRSGSRLMEPRFRTLVEAYGHYCMHVSCLNFAMNFFQPWGATTEVIEYGERSHQPLQASSPEDIQFSTVGDQVLPLSFDIDAITWAHQIRQCIFEEPKIKLWNVGWKAMDFRKHLRVYAESCAQ